MTAYVAITAAQIDSESPLDVVLAGQWTNNLLAVQEGDATAPKIQTAAYDTASVDQAAIGADAIGQSELKNARQDNTASIGGVSKVSIILTGGRFSLMARVGDSSGNQDLNYISSTSTTFTTALGLYNTNASARTYYLTHDYIQSSPPYDLGDGEIPLFVFVRLDGSGKVAGVDVAPDAPWHNNGPTDIRHKNGFQYRKPKPIINPKDDLAGYLAELKESKHEKIEITQAIKQADMGLIPHPFMDAKPTDSIVMLDPVCDDMWSLFEAREDPDFSIVQFLMDGTIKLDNTTITRATPPGVQPVKFGF